MQTKKSVKNITFGLLRQLVMIVIGIFLPKLYISYYGSDVNGLIATVEQIFVYIGLFEAGVGTATLVALYGPVAQDNRQKISGILAATNIYYKRAGLFYMLAVAAFAGIYPFLVKGDIGSFTIACLILISGITGILNFFFHGKFSMLLQAEGKGYVWTNLNLITYVLSSITKIILIIKGADIITVQSAFIVFNVLQVVIIYRYINRQYKWLNLKSRPEFDAISTKNSVLLHQISGLIFSNTDIIILSIFCDLKLVSVYAVYSMLFSVVSMAVGNISNGFIFRLGQMFNTDQEKFKIYNGAYELFYMALIFALYAIAFVFIIPFLKIYTANITDISYIDNYLPALFVTTNLLSYSRSVSAQTIVYAGHFKQTQWRSIAESIVNIGVSLVLVNLIGIYGVLLGTVCALLYRTNDVILYANKKILRQSAFTTYKRIAVNIALFLAVIYGSPFILPELGGYVPVILWAALYLVTVVPIFFLVNLLLDKNVSALSRRQAGALFQRIRQRMGK